MPKDMSRRLYPLLEPGTTLLLTDAPILEHSTGPTLAVMRSGLPEGEPAGAAVHTGNRRIPAPVESVRIN
jgi:hypothetical protein